MSINSVMKFVRCAAVAGRFNVAAMRGAAVVVLAVGFAGWNGSPAAQSEMPSLTVDIHATDSGMRLGSVLIEDTADGARFTPNLSGLTAGEHGFHVHVNPDCGMTGQNAGGHYDPANTGRHEARMATVISGTCRDWRSTAVAVRAFRSWRGEFA